MDWEAVLTPHLPDGISLARQGARTDENRKMLSAFRWNLRVLSYISLVVGAFLIYNTISISVVRRRAEIGILRALGATSGAVLAAFLSEAAFFGLVGSAVGLLLGRVMAEGAVEMMAATVRALYVSSTPGEIEITGGTVVIALVAGVGVAVWSAWGPAREAARVAAAEAMARGRQEFLSRMHTGRDLALAGLFALGALAASQAPPIDGKPLFGYLAALLLIAAAAFATPAVVSWLTGSLAGLLRRLLGVTGLLASRSLLASLGRTSVLVGALSTAVAMMASVGIMVGSFRDTVALWMENQLRADYYIRPAGSTGVDRHPTMDAAIADRIAGLPEVLAVDRFRAYEISYGGRPATLGAGQIEVVAKLGRLRFLDGRAASEALPALKGADRVVISEPFSFKHGLDTGDRIRIALGGKEVEFEVVGVYFDYSNERGFVIADRETLLKYLPDPSPTNLAVYLKPGVDRAGAGDRIREAIGGAQVFMADNQRLRTQGLLVFDRTFAITYALEAVAIVVAIMGMAGALLALVIDRRREIGVLRFLGASTGQIRRLILTESGLIGLLSNVVGLALGSVLSLILIYVINKQSFGWTFQFHWPVALLLGALTLIYVAAIVAGIYPARTAARLNPIEVMHEE
jgi:putative ABC transport system permease protein